MYSNKKNINILTALLVEHGIEHAVVCPGSRNAPIVNNLNECPAITCHPVTDERSAGFFALGIAQATQRPVIVCVTSGTALLNIAPAVAEATYQHHGIIAISADRPEAWIGQLDGQTMPQPGALSAFTGKCVTLPEPRDSEEEWYCNRLVNEALIECKKSHRPSVHINVPIAEPLFVFSTPHLPEVRKIEFLEARISAITSPIDDFKKAQKPMIVFGAYTHRNSHFTHVANRLSAHAVVIGESLNATSFPCHADEVLDKLSNCKELMPDFVLYVGDAIVSKNLKAFLRNSHAIVWKTGLDSDLHDTFKNLKGMVQGNPEIVLTQLLEALDDHTPSFINKQFIKLWNNALTQASTHARTFNPPYSHMLAVKKFHNRTASTTYDLHLHYANSTAVRLANVYSRHFVWCNRGINGIEGSVSTAAGYSTVATGITFLVTGDLSFFYDQNALWNRNLNGNLRILLINNGGGSIFRQLKGLGASDFRDTLVAAKHTTRAQGICKQNNIVYHVVHHAEELDAGLEKLMKPQSERPVLLEVITNPDTDATTFKTYRTTLNIDLENDNT